MTPSRTITSTLVGLTLLAAFLGATPRAAGAATGTGVISGTTFQDLNRNGAQDAGEAAFTNQQLYLFDSAGVFVAVVYSDTAGHYSFGGLADGTYTLAYASPSWSPIRDSWTPTTTPSVYPQVTLTVVGSAPIVANFGWRPITWSTDLANPISTYTGPNGLRAQVFNDVVPARDVYDAVMRGSLIGPEASHTVIRVGYGDISDAPTSIGSSNGVYNSFDSVDYITWGAWLDERDPSLFHEYGHSWSLYNAYIVQQDGTFSAYLRARGLAGDPRVGTSYKWGAGEMIAEDYRQLFATPAGQAEAQANDEIPRAADVVGLRTFLAQTYTNPPASPPPPPVVPVVVSGLAMAPNVVTKTGTISFNLSAPASVTVSILDSSGTKVRSLASSVATSAGTSSLAWNRTDDGGRRVRSGAYSVRVDATGPGGTVQATAAFTVK